MKKGIKIFVGVLVTVIVVITGIFIWKYSFNSPNESTEIGENVSIEVNDTSVTDTETPTPADTDNNEELIAGAGEVMTDFEELFPNFSGELLYIDDITFDSDSNSYTIIGRSATEPLYWPESCGISFARGETVSVTLPAGTTTNWHEQTTIDEVYIDFHEPYSALQAYRYIYSIDNRCIGNFSP